MYGCTFSGVIGTAYATNPPSGLISVQLNPSTLSQANVTISNITTGAASDYPFYVAATCPGGFNAVVAADGTIVVGAGVTSVSPELCAGDQHGCYQVVFNSDVVGCGIVAGLGESFTGTPPAGGISVAPRAGDADGVWVQAWNSAVVDTNESFHLSVYC